MGTLLRIDALADPVFGVVGKLGNQVISELSMVPTGRQRGRAIQSAWSVACDPDLDGSPFVIDAHPRCTACGSHEMAAWTELEGFIEMDLPHPTYSVWTGLSEADRSDAVRTAVIDALSF